MSKNKGMSKEMYEFIIDNLDKLEYNLEEGTIKTPMGTKGTVCSSTGYLRVKVNKKLLQVHQILSVIYYGESNIGMTVNHKDGNKLNNKKSNLEVITREDNVKHANENGLIRYLKGEEVYNSKLKGKQVLEIRKLLNDGISQRKLAELYKVSKGTIQSIKEEKSWKHI